LAKAVAEIVPDTFEKLIQLRSACMFFCEREIAEADLRIATRFFSALMPEARLSSVRN
jgi:hypothetical protein